MTTRVQFPWRRNTTATLGLELLGPSGERRCYERAPDGKLPAARLWFFQERPDRAEVRNVLPVDWSEFALEQYNALLAEFHELCAQPAAAKTGVMLSLTSDEGDLSRWLSAKALSLLRHFSATARRGTAASLPEDRRRWLDFVLCAHEEQSTLPARVLQQWLEEEEDWPETVAESLAGEYDLAGEVLEYAGQRALAA